MLVDELQKILYSMRRDEAFSTNINMVELFQWLTKNISRVAFLNQSQI